MEWGTKAAGFAFPGAGRKHDNRNPRFAGPVRISYFGPMEILEDRITIDRLSEMARERFGDMVKAVVDVRKRLIALDAELHSDEENLLLDSGSRQEDLWGINLYPEIDRQDPDFLEFDSMINLRPAQNNMSRGVEDEGIRNAIRSIVAEWIE